MLQIQPMGSHAGCLISGVDVKQLDDAGFAPIYDAWLKYGVIAVRGQQLELPDFLTYSRRFGFLVPHPAKSSRHPDHPEVTVLGINKFGPDGKLKIGVYKRGASNFHTDGAYDPVPFKATQLYALAIPSVGGDTHFSSMYAAYDALPERLKTLLDGRRAAFCYGGRRESEVLTNLEDRDRSPVFHPITPVHAESGRKSLYFDPGKIVYIEGLEASQNDEVLAELGERMIVPEGRYTHQWKVGDIVIWDNRCMVHKAAGDYPPEEDRIHWRVSIQAEPVFYERLRA